MHIHGVYKTTSVFVYVVCHVIGLRELEIVSVISIKRQEFIKLIGSQKLFAIIYTVFRL